MILLIGGLLLGHEALPDLDGRTPSTTLPDTADTRLGRPFLLAVAACQPSVSRSICTTGIAENPPEMDVHMIW